VGSDLLITVSYYAIPLILVYFLRQRKDFPYPWLIALFAAFIVACGTTHLLSVLTLWIPLYGLDAYVTAFTALVSVVTTIALIWIFPHALKLSSPAQLQAVVDARQEELKRLHEVSSRIYKENEEALRISEQRLQLAMQAGGVGLWDWNLQTDVLEWDDTMFALYGACREDFSGTYEAWSTRLHPEDKAVTEKAIQDAIAGIKDYTPEFRVIWLNGEVHHIKGHAKVIKDSSGKPLHMIGTNWDNYAYAEVQKKLQLAHITLSKSKNAYFWLSSEGQLVDVNDCACQSLGYSREELIGQKIPFFDSDFQEEDWAPTWLTLKKEQIRTFETHHQRKDGTIFLVEITANYVNLSGEEHCFAYVQDISQRKQREEALKTSEARFRTIVDKLPVPMGLNDNQQNITLVNLAFTQTFGYSLEDIPTLADWFPKAYPDTDYRQWIMKSCEAALIAENETQQSFVPIEIKLCCKNGTTKTVLISMATIAEYHITVLCDISERKKTEEVLQHSEAQYRAIIEDQNELICRYLPNGKLTFVNRAYAQYYKKELTELINENYIPQIPEPDLSMVLKKLAEINQEHPIVTYNHRIILDGETHWQQWIQRGIYSAEGKLVEYQAVGNDIGKRKQTEMELRVAATVFESQVGMTITDAGTKILKVNKAFTCLTGYSEEEVINQKPRILHSGRHDRLFYDALWQTIRKAGVWQGEIWNKRKNGEIYPEWLTITAVKNKNGVVTHYVATHSDITDIKRTETELQQAKEIAEAANQAKSEFLANMSHEIRTPMNAILGFSEILNDLITDTTQRYYLDAIHRSGKTLLQLINDILDLSKIEAGKLELKYYHVILKSIFDDVLVMFRQKLMERAIDFKLQIAKDIPPCLVLDDIRLRQILLNIVGNAVKFTENGFISINVSTRPQSSEQYINLIITITDSGIGIAKDQLESIFSAFTQQKNQNAHYGGTGLGLTITKRLVEIMGGTISVSSELGKGSCFTIELPDVEVFYNMDTSLDNVKNIPIIADINSFQPATLLVVDDIEINRELIKIYLQDYPELQLIEATTGEQALELVCQQHFDLIFMDRRLPNIDGDSVCQQIKAMPDNAAIPIIMISASVIATEHTQSTFFYDSQLKKPANKNELLSALLTFLPFNEATKPLTTDIAESYFEAVVSAEKSQELVEILMSCYQNQLEQLNNSGTFEIYKLIEIAEQLLELAEQYACPALADWATVLKTQASLFDLSNLTQTLTEFDELLKQLSQLPS
jgi:PAS domain S-box-containing protein